MSQLTVLPTLQNEPTLARDFREPAERRLLAPGRRAGVALELVGLTPIPQRPIVQRTATGTWFFAADYLDDAGLRQDGAIAIPENELAKLKRLRDAGVSVDLIWIGHELPLNWSPEQPLPPLVPDAQRYRELDQTLEQAVATSYRLSLKAVKETARGVALASLGLGAIVASAGVGLDPVVLGGIRHPREPVAAWTVLAQWHWE